MMSEIQLLTDKLFAGLKEEARNSERLRMNHNFHADMDEPLHRFLNVILKGSYIQPHRHLDPPKPESFVVLEGRLAFFIFHDNGKIQECHILDAKDPACARGIDVAAGIWHSLAALSESVVCFEVKPGPYKKASDKEFAPWAPSEGESGHKEYLDKLIEMI